MTWKWLFVTIHLIITIIWSCSQKYHIFIIVHHHQDQDNHLPSKNSLCKVFFTHQKYHHHYPISRYTSTAFFCLLCCVYYEWSLGNVHVPETFSI